MGSGTEKLPKTGIIIPWFGPWPEWIGYFLAGCRMNPEITWIIPTDQPAPLNVPVNVLMVPFNIAGVISVAEKKLGIKPAIPHPYKICDLKPAFGCLFEEFIEGYDYWGYGDLDLIYGKFSNYFTKCVFTNYDVISNHADFVSGHLCLLKNTPSIREMFLRGGNYREVFTNPDYVGFDELRLLSPIRTSTGDPSPGKSLNRRLHLWQFRLVHSAPAAPVRRLHRMFFPDNGRKKPGTLNDFTGIVRSLREKEGLRVRFETSFECDLMYRKKKIKNWKVEWEKGHLTSNTGISHRSAPLYFHFMLSKQSKSFQVKPTDDPPEVFTITKNGITPYPA